MPDRTKRQEGEETQTTTKGKVEPPPMFRVLLHNDDYTSMEFVVRVLREIFHRSEAESVHIMLAVHTRGIGVAGIYPFEVAETKVHRVHRAARAHDFPLKCSLERE